MKRITINIDDRAYPCYPTAGAMLRFKQETGKEVGDFDASCFTELFTFLWCCVASACARERIPFEYSVMELADMLDPDALSEWMGATQESALIGGDDAGNGKKKTRKK